jgi:hypothetical protein
MMSELLAGFVGAVLALLGQGVWDRFRKASIARGLAIAYWEELSAVRIKTVDVPQIGGFSSQTYDTLFRELAEVMPDSLMRDLMRYHWRMKLLDASQEGRGGVSWVTGLQEAEELRDDLLARLNRYADREISDLAVNRREKV